MRAAGHNIPRGIVNLIGGEQTSRRLNPNLVRKILAAELGITTANVTSLDGVVATTTPKHSTSSAVSSTGRRNEKAAAWPGGGLDITRSKEK
jgi:hypothetical protein